MTFKVINAEKGLHHFLMTLKVFDAGKEHHHCLKGFNTEKRLHHFLITLEVFKIEIGLHHFLKTHLRHHFLETHILETSLPWKVLILKNDSITFLRLVSLSWWRRLSYRNQSIDLQSKSMDWFLYDNSLHHERVKVFQNSYFVECRWTGACKGHLLYHISD